MYRFAQISQDPKKAMYHFPKTPKISQDPKKAMYHFPRPPKFPKTPVLAMYRSKIQRCILADSDVFPKTPNSQDPKFPKIPNSGEIPDYKFPRPQIPRIPNSQDPKFPKTPNSQDPKIPKTPNSIPKTPNSLKIGLGTQNLAMYFSKKRCIPKTPNSQDPKRRCIIFPRPQKFPKIPKRRCTFSQDP